MLPTGLTLQVEGVSRYFNHRYVCGANEKILQLWGLHFCSQVRSKHKACPNESELYYSTKADANGEVVDPCNYDMAN